MSDYELTPDYGPAELTAEPDLARLGAAVTASGAHVPADMLAAAGEVAVRLVSDDIGRGKLFVLFNVSGVSWDPTVDRFALDRHGLGGGREPRPPRRAPEAGGDGGPAGGGARTVESRR